MVYSRVSMDFLIQNFFNLESQIFTEKTIPIYMSANMCNLNKIWCVNKVLYNYLLTIERKYLEKYLIIQMSTEKQYLYTPFL